MTNAALQGWGTCIGITASGASGSGPCATLGGRGVTRNLAWVSIQESGQETLPRSLGARWPGQGKELKSKLSDVLSLLLNAHHAQRP